jgi:hypothetical protein
LRPDDPGIYGPYLMSVLFRYRNKTDIKYGPYIPGSSGRKKRTYLVAFIDDATRLVCHGEFYDNQRLPILEDCFRKAILKYGKPDAVYVDFGQGIYLPLV